jgi:hypothetical protein
MQLRQYCLLVTARSLYMFRTLSASIIRSTKNCSKSKDVIPTHDIHQWLLLQFLIFLMMDAESVRNM